MFLGLLVVGARMICLALLLFQSFFLTLASSESERALRNLHSSNNTHWNSSAGHFTLCALCGPPVALFWDAAKTIRLYFKWPVSCEPFTTQFNLGHASSSDAGKSWKLLLDFLKGKGAAPSGKEIKEPSFGDGAFCRVENQESSRERRVIYNILHNGKLMPTDDAIHITGAKYSFEGVHSFLCLRPENGSDYFTYILLANGKSVSIVAMDNVHREFGNGSSSSITFTGSGREDDFAEVSVPKLYDFPDQCRSLDHFQLEKERILVVFCWTEEDLKYVVGRWRFEDAENVSGARWFPGRLEFHPLASGHFYRGEEKAWTFLDGAAYHPQAGAAVGGAYSGIISMGWYGGVGVTAPGRCEWVPYQPSFMTLRELSILENGVITAKPWINTALLDYFEIRKVYRYVGGRYVKVEIPNLYEYVTGLSYWAKGAGAIVFDLNCTLKSGSHSTPLRIRFFGRRGLLIALEDKNETSVMLRIAARQKDTATKTCWTPSSPPPKKYKWSFEPECWKQIELPYKWSSRMGGDSITVVLDKQTVTVYASAGRVVVSMAHSLEDWDNLETLKLYPKEGSVDLHSAKLLKYAPVEVTDVNNAMAKIEAHQKIEAQTKAQKIEAQKKREAQKKAQKIEAQKKREAQKKAQEIEDQKKAQELEAQKKREALKETWGWLLWWL